MAKSGVSLDLSGLMLGSCVPKATPPTTISGAVSPIARDMARIVPVSIPGKAAGTVCRETACHLVAPSAIAPCSIETGTARIASRLAMMTIGSTSSARVSPPASRDLFRPMRVTNRARPSSP